MPAVAYSYARFSTPEQATGQSEERQIKAARKWCKDNEVLLDEGNPFVDRGKSGFHGRHLEEGGALAEFLRRVERGGVAKGSYLIAEDPDRLGRLGGLHMAALVHRIVSAGVRIVLLSTPPQVLTEDLDEMQVIFLVMQFCRGHNESKRKQQLISAVWRTWRESAPETRYALPGSCPFWLTKAGPKHQKVYSLNEDKAATVRLIFKLAEQGWGALRIHRYLVRQDVRVVDKKGSTGHPSAMYIRTILRNPAVYGRCEDLDIEDFFPPAITRDEFFRVQGVLDSRPDGKKHRERVAVRLLTGSNLRHHRTRTTYITRRADRGTEKTGREAWYYVPADSRGTAETEGTGFPVEALERAVLKIVEELDLSAVAGEDVAARLEALVGEAETVRARLETIEAELENGDVAVLGRVAVKLEARLADLSGRIAEERASLACPVADTLGEAKRLAGLDLTDEEVRLRVRAALSRLVAGIDVSFGRSGIWRMAWAVVRFRGTNYVRELVALYRRPVPGRKEYFYCDGGKVSTDEGTATPDAAWSMLKDIAEQEEAEEGKARAAVLRDYGRERYARITPEMKAKRAEKARQRYWRAKEGS